MRLWLLHRNPLAGRAHDILLHRILTCLLLSWPDHISCPTKRTSEGYKGLRASNLSWLRRPPPSLPRVRANISQQIIRSRAAQTRQTRPMSDQFFKVWVRSHRLRGPVLTRQLGSDPALKWKLSFMFHVQSLATQKHSILGRHALSSWPEVCGNGPLGGIKDFFCRALAWAFSLQDYKYVEL